MQALAVGALALGAGGFAGCGEDRGSVKVEGPAATSTTGTSTTGTGTTATGTTGTTGTSTTATGTTTSGD